MADIEERMKRLSEERSRLAAEEAQMRQEAIAELDRVNEQIDALEARKESLEAFLGLGEQNVRAGHGQIVQMCIAALSEDGGGLTSAQVKERIERRHPDTKLASVPGTLSRLVAAGRMRRDEAGRYYNV